MSTIARSLSVVALGITLAAGLGADANAGQDSGFLKDYSQLKVEKDPLGVERRIWVSPKFTRDNYKKILVEPVAFYPAPQASDRVTTQALKEIRDYLDASLRKMVDSSVPIADAPGPGVARLRVAITAASVDTGLKPYQLVPAALVFTAATRAAGVATYEAQLAVEAEMSDSMSGDPLGRSVRDARGIEVKGDEQLTLSIAKPKIDEWTKSVQEFLAAKLKAQ